jgi:hypothetical protein
MRAHVKGVGGTAGQFGPDPWLREPTTLLLFSFKKYIKEARIFEFRLIELLTYYSRDFFDIRLREI